MTEPGKQLHGIELGIAGGDPEGLVSAATPRALDEILETTPYWPVTRLVGWTLTVALGAGILTPAAIGQSRRVEWLALLLPAIVATLSARGLFEVLGVAVRRRRRLAAHDLAGRVLAALAPALLAAALMAAASAIVGVPVTVATSAVTAALGVVTLVAAGTLRDLEIRVRLTLRRVYFIGTREARADLQRELSRRHDATLVGAATVDGPADRSALADAVRASRPTVVVLDGDAMRAPALVDAAAQLNLAGMHIRDLVSYYEAEFKKVPLGELSPTWFLFDIAPIHRRLASRLVRRGLELTLAALLLVIALPVLCTAALAIKLSSRGPVLYRQRRVGKNAEQFTLVKLRTMALAGAGAGEAAWAEAEQARITTIGHFLRRFRLDELPQLWSVIKGDLALIGPRPEQVPIAERLDRELPHYGTRHCIRPGITGWAQVNLGYAGSVEGTIAKLQRDLYYVKHSSLRLDALILWLTFKTVIAGRG